MAKQRWGNKFLGIYYYDEPAGNWLDYDDWNSFFRRTSNSTYDTVAQIYVNYLQHDGGYKKLQEASIPAFTSDYALYWFDYLMGYEVVFAQIGWNHTIEQDIALAVLQIFQGNVGAADPRACGENGIHD